GRRARRDLRRHVGDDGGAAASLDDRAASPGRRRPVRRLLDAWPGDSVKLVLRLLAELSGERHPTNDLLAIHSNGEYPQYKCPDSLLTEQLPARRSALGWRKGRSYRYADSPVARGASHSRWPSSLRWRW